MRQILVLGGAESGKTQLVERLRGNEFSNKYLPTHPKDGFSFLKYEDEDVSIYEHPGPKRVDGHLVSVVVENRNLQMYTNSSICLFCIDVSNTVDWQIIQDDITRFRKQEVVKRPGSRDEAVQLYLVATKYEKSDHKMQVDTLKRLAETLKVKIFLTNAEKNTGIDALLKGILGKSSTHAVLSQPRAVTVPAVEKDSHVAPVVSTPLIKPAPRKVVTLPPLGKTKPVAHPPASPAHEVIYLSRETAAHLLTTLKKTTDELIRKGITEKNERYEKAAIAANDLHKILDPAIEAFLAYRQPTEKQYQAFRTQCNGAIDKANLEFINHRGVWDSMQPWIRWCLGVVSILAIVPALLVWKYSKHGVIATFFDPPPPASSEKLLEFKKQLLGSEEIYKSEIQHQETDELVTDAMALVNR